MADEPAARQLDGLEAESERLALDGEVVVCISASASGDSSRPPNRASKNAARSAGVDTRLPPNDDSDGSTAVTSCMAASAA